MTEHGGGQVSRECKLMNRNVDGEPHQSRFSPVFPAAHTGSPAPVLFSSASQMFLHLPNDTELKLPR